MVVDRHARLSGVLSVDEGRSGWIKQHTNTRIQAHYSTHSVKASWQLVHLLNESIISANSFCRHQEITSIVDENIWIGIGAVVVAVGFFFVVFVAGQRYTARKKAAYDEVIQAFGLVDQQPGGIYPDLRGEVDGVKVAVDTIFQRYARGGTASGQRPVARVRAQLTTDPLVQVRARAQRYEGKIDWPLQPLGYADFDERYELHVAPGADPGTALPQAVVAALMDCRLPVHIIGNVVVWTVPSPQVDGERLRMAVADCAQVAAAFNAS